MKQLFDDDILPYLQKALEMKFNRFFVSPFIFAKNRFVRCQASRAPLVRLFVLFGYYVKKLTRKVPKTPTKYRKTALKNK